MRILLCMCILSGGLASHRLAAQDPARISPPSSGTQAKKAPAVTVPKDAVETEPGFYRWTDKDGKVWTYRRSPFGVSRWPADSADGKQSAMDNRNDPAQRTTAVEQGDSIRFSEATPFGKRIWVRKKTELNDNEQSIWDLQRKNGTAGRAADKE
jgi:hypothetical protein